MSGINLHLEQFSMGDITRAINSIFPYQITSVTINNYFHRGVIEKSGTPGRRRSYSALDILQVAVLFYLSKLKIPTGEYSRVAKMVASRAQAKVALPVQEMHEKLGDCTILLMPDFDDGLIVFETYENDLEGNPVDPTDIGPGAVVIDPDWFIDATANALVEILTESGEIDSQDDHGEASREHYKAQLKIAYAEKSIELKKLEAKSKQEGREPTEEELKEISFLQMELEHMAMGFDSEDDE